MSRGRIAYFVFLAALFPLPHSAKAAGFYLQEQSVSGLGASFAGQAATARDASIVYFNPAGMTELDGGQMNVSAHLLMPRADLENNGSTIDANPGAGIAITALTGNDGGNPYDKEVLPNLHIAAPVNDRVWAGISVSAPFGLANQYNEGWFGRYDSTKTVLKTIDVSPSLAYKATDWLSLGAGLNVQHASAKLQSTVSALSAGESILEGDDLSFGYNAGVLAKPFEGTTLGAHYRSKISHMLDGRIVARGTGSAAVNRDSPGVAGLDLPDIAQFAVNQKIGERWALLGSATWFGWNRFETIKAVTDSGTVVQNQIQNYQATWTFGVGAEYRASDSWTLRAGYQFDETPTIDEYRTSRTPDGDRNWFSAGATYKVNDKFSLDLAATYIDIGEGEINVNRNIPTAVANVRARTEGQVGILALGLNYRF